MKKILAVLLCLVQPAWSATSVVNAIQGSVGGASPASATVTATTIGNGQIVCAELVDNTKAVTGVTCGSNTLVQGTSCVSTNSTVTTLVDCWYIASMSASCTSVQVTATATIGAIFEAEIAGGAQTNSTFFQVCGVANNLASAATLTGPSMTDLAGGTIFCAAADSNNAISVNSPYIGFLGENGHGSGYQSAAGIISGSAPVFNDSSAGAGNISCIAVNQAIASSALIQTRFGAGSSIQSVLGIGSNVRTHL